MQNTYEIKYDTRNVQYYNVVSPQNYYIRYAESSITFK